METEHFQAPFRVITSGSIQIEKYLIEQHSAEEIRWLIKVTGDSFAIS